MKLRNLIQIGLMGAALAVSARGQDYGPRYYGAERAERRDISRDMRRRDELARQVEADRRDVEHERHELRYSNWFTAGHESRELRRAQDRLNHDSAELRGLDAHIAGDMNRWR